jgi:hypothetical protein
MYNKMFSGHQPRQVVKTWRDQRFEVHLCSRPQGPGLAGGPRRFYYNICISNETFISEINGHESHYSGSLQSDITFPLLFNLDLLRALFIWSTASINNSHVIWYSGLECFYSQSFCTNYGQWIVLHPLIKSYQLLVGLQYNKLHVLIVYVGLCI